MKMPVGGNVDNPLYRYHIRNTTAKAAVSQGGKPYGVIWQ
jgi:hypothetical protein